MGIEEAVAGGGTPRRWEATQMGGHADGGPYSCLRDYPLTSIVHCINHPSGLGHAVKIVMSFASAFGEI